MEGLVIPDMTLFIREVSEKGNLGALMSRMIDLGIGGILTLGWWNLKNLTHLVKMEFAYGVLLLVQIELIKLKDEKADYILISDQITDLSVALKTNVILESSIKIIKKIRPTIKVGVMTNNFVRAVSQFYEWGLKMDLVVTPINSYGYEMNPNQTEVEELIKMNDKNKIAALTTGNKVKEREYLKRLGIKNQAWVNGDF
ncbi:MAG: hypothetical protein AAB574_01660 [Patescibacteria group bacterium]